mmetsp:Transcript_69698/g.196604  ORF Transcript_69698/g.196604 Transcript_69698/m.196604 type:complete len:212 (-) Transcript_69698:279-914(-)
MSCIDFSTSSSFCSAVDAALIMLPTASKYVHTCRCSSSEISWGMFSVISSTNALPSPCCGAVNFFLHFWQIFRNVSTAISWTPGKFSCMNSNSLKMTVFRNFQWARRKRGYWPTTYMMLLATMALFSLPRFISHRLSRSLIACTRKRFSSRSCMAPLMDPMAQHSRFSSVGDQCSAVPSLRHSCVRVCVMMASMLLASRCVRYIRASRIIL